MMKKIKRYLLLVALGSVGLFAGYEWLEDVIESAFVTVGSEIIEEEIKQSAEDRLKEKLGGLLEDAFK